MDQFRDQVALMAAQLKAISDQMELLQIQLKHTEEKKTEEAPYTPFNSPKMVHHTIPETENWDDDDEPPFNPTSGYSASAVKRIVRRAQSMCPACRKVGGCEH